jgi:hypothetical protein
MSRLIFHIKAGMVDSGTQFSAKPSGEGIYAGAVRVLLCRKHLSIEGPRAPWTNSAAALVYSPIKRIFSSQATRSLLQHDFSGLDDNLHSIALFQLHLIGALTRDYALDCNLAELDHHVCHDVSEFDLGDSSLQLIPRRKSHTPTIHLQGQKQPEKGNVMLPRYAR